MNRSSTADVHEQKPRRHRWRSYDQLLDVEVSLFAITVMASILALIYCVSFP
jgi:hypothetical protein